MATGFPAHELLRPALAIAKGVVIAQAGSEVRVVHLLVSGLVGRFVRAGEHQVLDAVRRDGWLLGAAPAISTGPHQATMRSLTACVLRPIPVDVFRHALTTLSVSIWLNEMLAAESFADAARQLALSTNSTRSRIEHLFVELMRGAGRPAHDGGIRLTMPLSVVEVAQYVGASREHTTRVLAELDQTDQLVKVNGWFVAPSGSAIFVRVHVDR